MSDKEVSIVYKNRFDEVKAYRVSLRAKTDQYQYVFDLLDNKPKTFSLNNILLIAVNHSSANYEAALLQKQYTVKPRPKKGTGPLRRNSLGEFEVCFTGFSRVEKTTLIKLAEEAKFYVAGSVTKNLELLVCGGNAGPKK